jgi:hypothetical protein
MNVLAIFVQINQQSAISLRLLANSILLNEYFDSFLSDGERCRQRKEFKNLPYIGFTFTSDKGKVQALECKVGLVVLKYCLLFFVPTKRLERIKSEVSIFPIS